MSSLASYTLTTDDTEYTSTFTDVDGEEEDEYFLINQFSSNSIASIKLCDYLSSVNLEHLYYLLDELGLHDIYYFYHISEKDLEDLCTKIKHHNQEFDFIEKLKFKAAIRNLPKSNLNNIPRSSSNDNNDVETKMSQTEKQCMENVEKSVNKIENIQTFYEQYITNDIQFNVNNVKQEIESKFKYIIKQLHKLEKYSLLKVKYFS